MGSEEGVPTASLDYMSITDDDTAEDKGERHESRAGIPILVMVDHATDMTFSSDVPKKGVNLMQC